MGSSVKVDSLWYTIDVSRHINDVSGESRFFKLASIVSCGFLVALVLACYVRTLNSYFLADDFGLVSYVANIWNGRWHDYWLDWISNTQRLPGMAVYRPWFITTLVLDYAVWHANAFGFYLTNLVYFVLDVLLFFAVARQLTKELNHWDSLLCAFFAAALFAVSPLHPESVSWVGGRTDTICCTFFLAALLLFLRKREKHSKFSSAGSVLCFWLGILTKEMAIALPVVVTAVALFFARSQSTAPGTSISRWRSRIVTTLKESAPYWISTLLYFTIRYFALGTVSGGYVDGLDGQKAALAKFLDLDSLWRLLFPLGIAVFEPRGLLFQLMQACYLAGIALIAVRVFRHDIHLKNFALLIAWTAAATVPIFQVWGIGLNLEGARYYFFLTLPMALSLPLLLFGQSKSSWRQKQNKLTYSVLPALILSGLVLTNYMVTSRANALWLHAGREVRNCTRAAVELAKQTPAEKRIPVLGIPKDNNGAHMIYNGATFLMAVRQPFFKDSFESRFETFDPIFFGSPEFINSARFKNVINSSKITPPYIWDRDNNQWRELVFHRKQSASEELELSTNVGPGRAQIYMEGHACVIKQNDHLKFSGVKDGDGLLFSGLDLCPLDYDYIAFDYRLPATDVNAKIVFRAKWRGASLTSGFDDQCAAFVPESITTATKGKWHSVRVPVSHYWHWYSSGNIQDIALLLPPIERIDLRSVRVLSDRHLRPRVSIVGREPDARGICNAGSSSKTTGAKISVDATLIPNAKKVLLECTKPNYFFDLAEKKELSSAIYARRMVASRNLAFELNSENCPGDGLFELRARALDANGNPVGEYSEPLTIFLASRSLSQADARR